MQGQGSKRGRPKRQAKTTSSTEPPIVDGIPDHVSHYARQVLSGAIVAGPYVRAACERHFRDLAAQQTKAFPFYFDREAADRALRFFPSKLRLSEGQFDRKPFELHTSQKFIVGSIFGWKRVDDGFRRFRRAYIEEGKGNGKSPLAAGVGLYCFMADREPGAEVYVAGPVKDQAEIIFQDAVKMVDKSPDILRRVRKRGKNPVQKLTYVKTGSIMKPISSDDKKSGHRPSCGLIDEIHEHKNALVVDMLERGFKWRRNPLLFEITNSGSDMNTLCGREHQHAVDVVTGKIQFESTFAFVCGLDEEDLKEDRWLKDRSCWQKANPLLNVTVSEVELDRECQQAIAMPGIRNEIARLRFCIWTDAPTVWMPRETLEPCFADFDPMTHRGKAVSISLDLSQATDLTCAAYMAKTGERDFIERDPDTGESRAVKKPCFDLWVDTWTPGDTLTQRALVDKRPYDVWQRNGFLIATPGKAVRFDFVAARIAWINSNFRVRGLSYDQYAFREFEKELQNIDCSLPLFWHPQAGTRRGRMPQDVREQCKVYGVAEPDGLWMPASLRALESMIYERRIRIQNNPVVKSAMSAVTTESDPWGNRWMAKRKATNRIDAAVASCMVAGMAVLALPEPPDLSGFLKNAVFG